MFRRMSFSFEFILPRMASHVKTSIRGGTTPLQIFFRFETVDFRREKDLASSMVIDFTEKEPSLLGSHIKESAISIDGHTELSMILRFAHSASSLALRGRVQPRSQFHKSSAQWPDSAMEAFGDAAIANSRLNVYLSGPDPIQKSCQKRADFPSPNLLMK